MAPRVSICVPNLNTRPFLAERFDTIRAQSFRDWELLVYDSYSDDGAWEYIRDVAAREPRARAWQGPRAGTPGSWSPCVSEARGEYVYIATSDDTMPPDCLEKLVAALDAHPECDIAHCPLQAIDEHGRCITAIGDWWRNRSMFAESSGDLIARPHVRRAPFDGLLHLLGGSVYISITQLLIRRSLFDRIGYFESTWGSIGDFNWDMRAGLVANTLHVPDTWGGWRVHSSQATAAVKLESAEHAERIDDMIDDAIARCGDHIDVAARQPLASRWVHEARTMRTLLRDISSRRRLSVLQRRSFLLGRMCTSSVARQYVFARARGRSPADWVRQHLAAIGFGPALLPIAPTAAVPFNREVQIPISQS
jgi:glycosyltransferase involved in cell wall biosynthesis